MRWACVAVLGCALVGCDRGTGATATASRPVSREASEAEKDDVPGVVTPDVVATTSRAVVGGKVLVEGRELEFPPAKLAVGRNGNVVLLADGGTSGNSVMFSFRPTTDGEVPWRRATWKYQLTSRDEETTDGIYIGGPDHHLRAVELAVEILRGDGGGTAEIKLRGAFVRADADDLLQADRFKVEGTFPAAIEDAVK